MSAKEKENQKPKQIYKKVYVKIRGLTPLLMNHLNPESLKTKSRMKMQDYSTKDDAEKSRYVTEIDGKEQLYIPQECVYSMLIKTARQYRVRRVSLSSLLAGTMRIEPEKILLGTDKYEIDERAVVIQGQRILKGRAKIPLPWSVNFTLVFNAKYLPEGIEPTLFQILEDAGVRMGLLDYRPQHQGWFGTFEIEKFIPEGAEDMAKTGVPAAVEGVEVVEAEEEPVENGLRTIDVDLKKQDEKRKPGRKKKTK